MAERRSVKVWLSVEEFELVDGLAAGAGVETGAVCREAIVRAAGSVARDVAAGAVRLRRRSGSLPEVPRVRTATTAVVGDLGPRDAPVEVLVPVLEQSEAVRLMMERQRRLNKARSGGG